MNYRMAGEGVARMRTTLRMSLAGLALGGAVAMHAATLQWKDASTDEAGFRIERAPTGGNFTEIGSVGANVTTFSDATTLTGDGYMYRVAAFGPSGVSGYSNVAVPGGTINSAPTLSSIASQTGTPGVPVGPLAFTIGDAESPAAELTLNAWSSNPAVVATSGISFGGSGTSRTLTLATTSQAGSTNITVTVSDGYLTASRTFTVTTVVANTAPTISTIANQTGTSGAPVGPLAFTIGDAQTSAGALTLTASSSNPAVVASSGVSFGGSGSSRTVTLATTSQAGSTNITVTVSDGSLTASRTFSVTTGTSNTAPTLSTFAAKTITEDTSTGAIAFTIGDAQTAPNLLSVTATSSNQSLAPSSKLVLGGSNANRTLTVTPEPNANGTATITVTVSDGTLSTSRNFVLTVSPVNDAPTLSSIAHQTALSGSVVGPLGFSISDPETGPSGLTVTAVSSNPLVVSGTTFVFSGNGPNRTLKLTLTAGRSGTATITMTVSDGALTTSRSFNVTSTLPNTAPTLSTIAAQTVNEDASTGPIAFTIGDAQTAPGQLSVTASSSNATLVPAANLVLGGADANRTLTITPAANLSGTATITVTVSDGALTASRSFALTVTAVNDAPTITAISNQTSIGGQAVGPVPFTIGDAETSVSSLIVWASASDPAILPANAIVLGGSGANRSMTLTPAAGQFGVVTVWVHVSDGMFFTARSLQVTVEPQPISNPPMTQTDLVAMGTLAEGQTVDVAFSVDAEESRRVLVRAVGPTLSQFGVTEWAGAPRIQILDATGRVVHESAAWGGDPAVAAVFAPVGAFPLPPTSLDAAAVVTLPPGDHRVRVVDGAGQGTVFVQIFDAGPAAQ